MMTTGDIGDGKDIEVVTKCVFLGALIAKDGLCDTIREGSAKTNSYGKSHNGRTNINMEGHRSRLRR